MKKKILIWAGISVLAVLLIALVVVGLFLGNIVKTGMETVGPKITLTTLTVDSVNVSFTGSAGVNGLVLGNPEGYKTTNAISVGKAAVSVAPGSVLGSKIVIHSVEVKAPEITFEGNPFGENNLKKIMDNVNTFTGGGNKAATTNTPASSQGKGASKKLQVDHFLISGAKVHVSLTGMGGKELDLVLPPIEFNNLGDGPDGITAADLTKKVLGQITTDTIKAVGIAVTDLGKDVGNLGKDAGKTVGTGVDKLKKGIGGLFGK